MDNLNNRL